MRPQDVPHGRRDRSCASGRSDGRSRGLSSSSPAAAASSDVLVTGCRKGREMYLFIYPDDPISIGQVMRTIGRWAADEDLSFDWSDAARCCQAVEER